jgi:hypothetical protein
MGLVEEGQQLVVDYRKPLQELLLDVIMRIYKSSEELTYLSYETIGALGLSMGIMSESLRAFLNDVWSVELFGRTRHYSIRPDYVESERPICHEIVAMGYLPEAPDWSLILNMDELVAYTARSACGVPLILDELTATKDCWWYVMNDTTYDIYGLMSPHSRADGKSWPDYYIRRMRRTCGIGGKD